MHFGVGVGFLERPQDAAAQVVIERVALLGPVERDAPYLGRGVVDEYEIGTPGGLT